MNPRLMKSLVSLGVFLLLAPMIVAGSERPNIILVMTDDQGYGDLACHGNPIIQTPHLDRLHAESVRFTSFHVSPTCAPTRAALMTGRHEFKNGVTHTIHERERLTLGAKTLAQVLKGAGYATGIFGKWHLGDEPAYQPGRRGFDEVFIHGGGGIGQSYPGSCGDAPGNRYFDPIILHNGRFEKTRGYCTDVFFDQALRWIETQRNASVPFFCYLTPNAPHDPLDVPAEYEQRYAGKVPPRVSKFYGMITNIDDNIGRLMTRLKESDLDRNTVVIFMTDNGSANGAPIFNAGMRGAKGTPYEGGIRVPAFWRWQGKWRPADVPALTAHIDVLPTLAQLTGAALTAELRAQVEGRSFVPLLEDPSAKWAERHLITHVGRWPKGRVADAKYAKCAVRNSRFALVNNSELYDLASDPAQAKNVIEDHQNVAESLRGVYEKWWSEVQPMLVNEDAVGPPENPFKTLFREQFGSDREL